MDFAIAPLSSNRVLVPDDLDLRLYLVGAGLLSHRVVASGLSETLVNTLGVGSTPTLASCSYPSYCPSSSSSLIPISSTRSGVLSFSGSARSSSETLVKGFSSSAGDGSSSKSSSAQVLASYSARLFMWTTTSDGIGRAIHLSREITFVLRIEYIL